MPAFTYNHFSSQFDIQTTFLDQYDQLIKIQPQLLASNDRFVKVKPRFTPANDYYFKVLVKRYISNDQLLKAIAKLSDQNDQLFKVIAGSIFTDKNNQLFKVNAGLNSEQFDKQIKTLPKLSTFEDMVITTMAALPTFASNEDSHIKLLPRFAGYSDIYTLSSVGDYLASDYTNDYILDGEGNNGFEIFQVYANQPKISDLTDNTIKFLPRLKVSSDNLFKVDIAVTGVTQTDWLFQVYAFQKLPLSQDTLFQVNPHWRLPDDQLFQVFAQIPEEVGIIQDPILTIMLMLKNNWSLTESNLTASDLIFSTGWYESNTAFPQITVTPIYNSKVVEESGDKPLYRYEDTIHIDVWVRPFSDSGKALGLAKHNEDKIKKEIERIIRSGSHIGHAPNNEAFIYAGGWRRKDELNLRPVLLRSTYIIKDVYFRKTYEVF
jgi:hypothetical protein